MNRADSPLAVTQLADAIPHIVWTTDATGSPTYFNAKWTELTGLDLAETIRVGAVTTIHQADRDAAVKAFAEGMASGRPHEATYRLRRADGAYRWHRARVVPLRVESDRVTAWVGTASDVDEERTLELQQRHLVSASAVLGTSLDLAQTLNDVAGLLVPHVADWCAIDLVGDGPGSIERQAVAHVDPTRVALAWELWERQPPKPDDPHGVFAVVRSGQPELIREIPDALLAAAIQDPEILRIARSLGLHSSMCVPLMVRGRAIGALSLVSAESRKVYGPPELAFAAELAVRIAIAVDNARLYGAAERARAAAEAVAADVVEQCAAAEAALATMRAERDAALARAARDSGSPVIVAAGATSPPGEDLGAFARGKLTRVFGDARGGRLYDEVLGELGSDGVGTPDELQAFARRLTGRGGMEAAVGGLLAVAATLRGARD